MVDYNSKTALHLHIKSKPNSDPQILKIIQNKPNEGSGLESTSFGRGFQQGIIHGNLGYACFIPGSGPWGLATNLIIM